MTAHPLRGDAVLLVAAALWGAAFVAQRVAAEHVGALTFNGLRFALGTLVLLPVVLLRRRSRSGSTDDTVAAGGFRPYVVGGLTAGLVLFAGATLQQMGMASTTAGKGGFITGLYVPLVPIFGLVIGQRTVATTWLGVLLALVGLYFLSVTGPLRIERGDALVLGCAVVWAVHVLLVGFLVQRLDPLKLGVVQFATVAVVSLLAAAPTESTNAASLYAALPALLYGGFISVGIAYTLQLVGQRSAPPGHAAILLSLEAVFAALTGAIFLSERLGPREMCGAALMLAGMLVSQLPRLRPRPARATN